MSYFFYPYSGESSTTTFVSLYGEDLDRELGTSDRTQRFTLPRRKAALNLAQTEFIERTECLVGQFTITVTDEVGEYDLEALVTDYLRIAKAGPSLKMVDANGNERYAEGDKDFPQKDAALRNRQTPGWRASPDGTPIGWYLRRHGGSLFFGLTPSPDIPAGETWTIVVPCVVRAVDMVDDTSKPFTMSGGISPLSLTPWHPALVHWAAWELEKYRKDLQRQAIQEALFEKYVMRYLKQDRPKGGRTIQMATNYRQHARKGFRRMSVNADTVT